MDSKRKHDIVGYGKIGHCKHFRRWECIARQDMVRQGKVLTPLCWFMGKHTGNGCDKHTISGGDLRPSDEPDKTLHVHLSSADVLNSTKIARTAGRQGFVWFVIDAGRSLLL